ncbi:MAG: hypothetical protein KIS30_09290 [Thermoplasmata archaeon]|nr:hypothetical protein [Candidatus Sysuiplasma acidicola]MBX8646932.1 hypothetical protein [Candidatus Sysuiplasma acidicola]
MPPDSGFLDEREANVNANGTLATQRSAQASSEPGPATIAARPGSRSIPEPRTELT